jgi:hypothetical protein
MHSPSQANTNEVLGPPPSITEDIQRLQLNAKEEKERKRAAVSAQRKEREEKINSAHK